MRQVDQSSRGAAESHHWTAGVQRRRRGSGAEDKRDIITTINNILTITISIITIGMSSSSSRCIMFPN